MYLVNYVLVRVQGTKKRKYDDGVRFWSNNTLEKSTEMVS